MAVYNLLILKNIRSFPLRTLASRLNIHASAMTFIDLISVSLKRACKPLSALAPLVIFSGVCFPGSNVNHVAAGSGSILFFPEVWVGGLQYFSPFPVLPVRAYPAVQWPHPCFPFASCRELRLFRRNEQREKLKLQQPKPVFGQGAPLADESMEAWRAGLRPAVEPFRTDTRQIVPAFREHSLTKPEYREAGSILPRFSTGTK